MDADGDGVPADEDCDDGDPLRFPGNEETCDGIDNDCDGSPGEDEVDWDGDGLAECTGDCDDADAENFEGNEEVCDGADNDCDLATNEQEDADGDGWSGLCDADCDDADPNNQPFGVEVCDGQDNDCDGAPGDDEIDDDADGQTECDGDCDDADDANFTGNPEVCDGQDNDCSGAPDADEVDVDTDGWLACEECDDEDIAAYPGAAEVPDDGIDQDCDGFDSITCFEDLDGDGEGSDVTIVSADEDCADAGESETSNDCDDGDPALVLCPNSCADILAADLTALTEPYLLDPCDTGTPTEYWCDMDTEDGGWTLAGRQDASATTTLGLGVRNAAGDPDFSSDLGCVVFTDMMVFNETFPSQFVQSYLEDTWAYTSINLAHGDPGDAFKHGTYGPSGSLIVMGCVDYVYGGGLYPQYACDTDGGGGAKGHIADYAGEYCPGARLDYTWAWTDGSACSYRGVPYAWGYAVR